MFGPNPAVFFDRDGVLIESSVRDGKPYPPRTEDEIRLDEHGRDAIRRLRAAGFSLAVITNQPDVARKTVTAESVNRINAATAQLLGLSPDSFFTCFHDDADGCSCRKPGPSLVYQAARHCAADLSRSFVVGDRWRDIGAAHRGGCRAIWIDRGYRERPPDRPYHRVVTLGEAVDWIINAEP
ncbi:HAD family hydrolase [Allokutzneria sp. A3M-2-11 16]|uniref:HAD family hydrolase n=1 Tax=Allokutzneria sp. A3M-2-11 16 TaxID=2962043 RepID=UPI0020B65423|nr:HAD family hydrolase [Allokutzneria sp. A3M-2-11 16]MCP3801915.1 HAD family hydrolase [Allokutzneria sp. A3M-2-11 16]